MSSSLFENGLVTCTMEQILSAKQEDTHFRFQDGRLIQHVKTQFFILKPPVFRLSEDKKTIQSGQFEVLSPLHATVKLHVYLLTGYHSFDIDPSQLHAGIHVEAYGQISKPRFKPTTTTSSSTKKAPVPNILRVYHMRKVSQPLELDVFLKYTLFSTLRHRQSFPPSIDKDDGSSSFTSLCCTKASSLVDIVKQIQPQLVLPGILRGAALDAENPSQLKLIFQSPFLVDDIGCTKSMSNWSSLTVYASVQDLYSLCGLEHASTKGFSDKQILDPAHFIPRNALFWLQKKDGLPTDWQLQQYVMYRQDGVSSEREEWSSYESECENDLLALIESRSFFGRHPWVLSWLSS